MTNLKFKWEKIVPISGYTNWFFHAEITSPKINGRPWGIKVTHTGICFAYFVDKTGRHKSRFMGDFINRSQDFDESFIKQIYSEFQKQEEEICLKNSSKNS